jgi:hypothetical protein
MRVANAVRIRRYWPAFLFAHANWLRRFGSPVWLLKFVLAAVEIMRLTKTLTNRIRFMPVRSALISKVPPQIEKAFRVLKIGFSAISHPPFGIARAAVTTLNNTVR